MDKHFEEYLHYGQCLCVTNGTVELKIPLQFGIRIIYCALAGRENIFYEQPFDEKDLCTPRGWRIYGGHRIWVAPESDATCCPDEKPVTYSFAGDRLRVEQEIDKQLNVQKSLEVSFDADDPYGVKLRHTVKNMGEVPLKCSVWTVSAMAYRSVVSVPFAGKRGGFTPQRFISLWGDTDLCDPRLNLETDRVVFRHAADEKYFKIGLWCRAGMARCVSHGQLLEKRFDVLDGLSYPDGGVNVEVFQCRHMMEFEVLGPLTELDSGEEASHTEYWRITDAE
jgi:hypothetical protein